MQIKSDSLYESTINVKVTTTRKLNAAQSLTYLKGALAGKDLDMFKTVNLDRREAARFIVQQAKILRYVCISAGLPSITALVEQIYYSASHQSILRDKKDYQEFRELLKQLVGHS
jgi:hypothetical protein